MNWKDELVFTYHTTTEERYARCWEEYRSYNKHVLPGCLLGKERYTLKKKKNNNNKKLILILTECCWDLVKARE